MTRHPPALALLLPAAALGLSIGTARLAEACPDCPTAQEARLRVAEDHPGRWALVSLAPFGAVAALGAALHRVGRPRDARVLP